MLKILNENPVCVKRDFLYFIIWPDIVHDIMAVRQVKKQAAHIRAQKLLIAAHEGDVKLLKEMKNIKSGKNYIIESKSS